MVAAPPTLKTTDPGTPSDEWAQSTTTAAIATADTLADTSRPSTQHIVPTQHIFYGDTERAQTTAIPVKAYAMSAPPSTLSSVVNYRDTPSQASRTNDPAVVPAISAPPISQSSTHQSLNVQPTPVGGISIASADVANKGPFDPKLVAVARSPSESTDKVPGTYPGDDNSTPQVSVRDTASRAAGVASQMANIAATTAASLLPKGVVDTVSSYMPTSNTTSTMSEARASEHDDTHKTSFPTTERGGASTGEHVGGVGSLPGPRDEEGIAKLPHENTDEERYLTAGAAAATIASAAHAVKDATLNGGQYAMHTAQNATAKLVPGTTQGSSADVSNHAPRTQQRASTLSTFPILKLSDGPPSYSSDAGALGDLQGQSRVAHPITGDSSLIADRGIGHLPNEKHGTAGSRAVLGAGVIGGAAGLGTIAEDVQPAKAKDLKSTSSTGQTGSLNRSDGLHDYQGSQIGNERKGTGLSGHKESITEREGSKGLANERQDQVKMNQTGTQGMPGAGSRGAVAGLGAAGVGAMVGDHQAHEYATRVDDESRAAKGSSVVRDSTSAGTAGSTRLDALGDQRALEYELNRQRQRHLQGSQNTGDVYDGERGTPAKGQSDARGGTKLEKAALAGTGAAGVGAVVGNHDAHKYATPVGDGNRGANGSTGVGDNSVRSTRAGALGDQRALESELDRQRQRQLQGGSTATEPIHAQGPNSGSNGVAGVHDRSQSGDVYDNAPRGTIKGQSDARGGSSAEKAILAGAGAAGVGAFAGNHDAHKHATPVGDGDRGTNGSTGVGDKSVRSTRAGALEDQRALESELDRQRQRQLQGGSTATDPIRAQGPNSGSNGVAGVHDRTKSGDVYDNAPRGTTEGQSDARGGSNADKAILAGAGAAGAGAFAGDHEAHKHAVRGVDESRGAMGSTGVRESPNAGTVGSSRVVTFDDQQRARENQLDRQRQQPLYGSTTESTSARGEPGAPMSGSTGVAGAADSTKSNGTYANGHSGLSSAEKAALAGTGAIGVGAIVGDHEAKKRTAHVDDDSRGAKGLTSTGVPNSGMTGSARVDTLDDQRSLENQRVGSKNQASGPDLQGRSGAVPIVGATDQGATDQVGNANTRQSTNAVTGSGPNAIKGSDTQTAGSKVQGGALGIPGAGVIGGAAGLAAIAAAREAKDAPSQGAPAQGTVVKPVDKQAASTLTSRKDTGPTMEAKGSDGSEGVKGNPNRVSGRSVPVEAKSLHPNIRPRAYALGGPGVRWGDNFIDGEHARDALIRDYSEQGDGYDTDYHPAALHPLDETKIKAAPQAPGDEKNFAATQSEAKNPAEVRRSSIQGTQQRKSTFLDKLKGEAKVLLGKDNA